jgi:Domain of unknown function (DUF4350)
VRGALGLVLLVLAVNALGALLAWYLREPGGNPWSSAATRADGLAAYASLLRSDGRTVLGAREKPAQARAPAGATIVLLQPEEMGEDDARALRRWLEDGGRLVAGATPPGSWLASVMARPPRWAPLRATRTEALVPVPETAGVREVRGSRPGAWTGTGGALPVVGRGRRSLVAVAAVGRGRLVLLADPSPLSNLQLAQADNAALGLALAGARERPVLFADWAHGHGRATGLAALPGRWRMALAGLGMAALAFGLARGRRFGPPQPPGRPFAPARALYVDALAATLARTGRPGEAAEPVRFEARRLLRRRAGLPEDADPAALRTAARRAGLASDEQDALLGRIDDERQVLAAGRALARLSGGGR